MQNNQTNSGAHKEWSNPTPAGLVALAVACVCFFAMLTGRVGANSLPLIACWLAGGFVVQLIVALLDLKGQNHTGGNTFLFFSAFFMMVGAFEMLLKYRAIMAGTPLDTHIDGYAWTVLAIALLMWTPAFFKTFSLLSVIVLLLDAALPFIALIDLGVLSSSFSVVPAWSLLMAGILAIYLCSAQVVNQAYGRVIYPLPGSPKNKVQRKSGRAAQELAK